MSGISPEVIAFGLGVGVLIGLTGIGGGSLMTPLLVAVLGVSPVIAVGTDVTYAAVTKSFGGYKHLRKGTVDMGVAKWLAWGGMPGVLVGVVALDSLHSTYGKGFNDALLACLAGALLVVAAAILAHTFLLPGLAKSERDSFNFTLRSGVIASLLGFILGFLLGLTSVGSGALIGVAMIAVFRLTPRRVAGSSVFLAGLLLSVAAFAQIASGNVNFALVGNILIGSVPGVWVGSHFIDRVPEKALRVTLSAVLFGSALALVNTAGGGIPGVVVFGAPLAICLVGYLRRRSLAGPARAIATRPAALAVMAGSPIPATVAAGTSIGSDPAGRERRDER